nr:hypothetical protein [Hyphomonas sp. Mor2]
MILGLAINACATAPSQQLLVDCAAAGQFDWQTYNHFEDEMHALGIQPHIQIWPHMHAMHARLSRLLLNGETEISPDDERLTYGGFPPVSDEIEKLITERMRNLAEAPVSETRSLNRKCNRQVLRDVLRKS